MVIEFVESDNSQTDLVAEARGLLAAAPKWKLISFDASETHTRIGYYEHGSRFTVATVRTFEGPIVDKPLAHLFARAPDLLFSLCNELEQLRSQHSVQAETIMEFQEEQRALMAALRSVPLLVEAAKGVLNVHTWRGKKGYESALRDGIRELQAAVSDMPDVAGMLLNLNSAPKGRTEMKVKDLREALKDVDDEMVVLLRVNNDDGDEQFMCSPSSALPDPGCGEVEMFMIDGTDGECEHGIQASECKERHADEYVED